MSVKILYTAFFASIILSCGNLNEVMKEVGDVLGETSTVPTNVEIANGLKEALVKGTSNGVTTLHQVGGYLENPQLKIPFPSDAQKIESTLRSVGLGSEVDKVIVSLNRAAEDAVTEAKPLFVNAIKQMTFSDVKNILFGHETAATDFLKGKVGAQLTSAFQPKIQASLNKVNATKYWEDIISQYNKIPLVTKMNPDLTSFVTEQAIKGLFLKIAEEEMAIRENPLERTTSLLQKVFNYADERAD